MTESEGGEYSTNFRSILKEILDYSEWKTIEKKEIFVRGKERPSRELLAHLE